MPELPEVETIRRGLSKRIIGKTIVDLEVLYPKTFQGDKSKVENYKVKSIERRAKVIAIGLSNGYFLLFHLKMTGQLIWRMLNKVFNSQFPTRLPDGQVSNQSLNSKSKIPNSEKATDYFAGGHPDHEWHAKLPDKTTALVFTFDDGSVLFFNDMRKFGWCKVLSKEQLNKIFTEDYGSEPFDKGFNIEYLMLRASKIPNRNIKQFLTDQTVIAGIGNIYADEILFESRISPLRKVKDIQLSEWKKIIEDTKMVLEKGIKYGGTTDSDYVDAEGKKGGMQNHLNVYHKTGGQCPANCGGTIKRITVGGRGTHYCPSCQH